MRPARMIGVGEETTMGLGSMLRDEFPHGWWRSARWWLTGMREIALNVLAAVATVAFTGEMRRVVRHRDEPQKISRRTGTAEGYVASFVFNSIGLGVLIVIVIEGGLSISAVPVVLEIARKGG